MKTAVITGGSSGLGKAAAELFACHGWQVYELSRSGKDGENIRHIYCDMAESSSIQAAFAQIADAAPDIDLLINNAGMGIAGAAELQEEADVRRIIEVDMIAPWLCAKAALPLLRKNGGRIINISSVAAVFALPYQSFYSGVKAAISSISQSMGIELAGSGVSVTCLMPGDVKTGFTESRVSSVAAEPLYGDRPARSLAVMEKDEQNGMDPKTIAAKLLSLAEKTKVKSLYTCGGKYKLFLLLGKILPCSAINKIVSVMYKG